MSQMTDETLSALLDGECSPAELDRLLEAMERDPALKARYSRMCLARDSLKGGRARSAHLDFSSRVLAALDPEPAARVVPLRRVGALAPDPVRGRLWRPLAGLAAAAALAAVAVLAIRPQPTEAPVAVGADGQAADGVDRHWAELDADNARRLNRYLAAHSKSRVQQGVGGTLSYARYAAFAIEPQEQAR